MDLAIAGMETYLVMTQAIVKRNALPRTTVKQAIYRKIMNIPQPKTISQSLKQNVNNMRMILALLIKLDLLAIGQALDGPEGAFTIYQITGSFGTSIAVATIVKALIKDV